MQPGLRASLLWKICLPLVLLSLLSLQPGAGEAARSLQQAYADRQAGHPQLAAQAFHRAYQRQPWRKDLLEAAGVEEFAAGQYEQAARDLQAAADAGVISLECWDMLGQAYSFIGNDPSAEAAWLEALRAGGPSPRVYERLAGLYRARGDFAKAEAVLRDWRSADPQDPRAAYLLGLLLSVSAPQEAQPLLVESAQKDTTYTPTVQILRTGLSQAAQSDNPAYAWLIIGRALGSAGQWDLARQAFQQSLAAAPNYAEAWAFLGEASFHLGQDGKTELDQAMRYAPDSPVVRALTSLYWRRQGQYDRALANLEAIASLEPREPTWQVEMGGILAEKGDLQAARARYEAAAALAPDQSRYWQYLAAFAAQYNVDPRGLGLPAARKAVILSPNDAGALDAMGQVMIALGDLASAERFLQRALEKDTPGPQVFLHLGQLYLQQSETARARPYLERARELAGAAPAGEIATRLLKQYYGE